MFEPLKDYEGYYEINKDGEIKSLPRSTTGGGLIAKTINKNGYYYVNLCKNGIQKTFTLHRLLALQYIENSNKYPVVDHIDRIRTNNSLDNLRWVDYQINSQNRTCKGCISTTHEKYKDKIYTYYRVSYKNIKISKRFKTLEEAQEQLVTIINENLTKQETILEH